MYVNTKNTDGINTRPTTTNKEYQGSKVSNAKYPMKAIAKQRTYFKNMLSKRLKSLNLYAKVL